MGLVIGQFSQGSGQVRLIVSWKKIILKGGAVEEAEVFEIKVLITLSRFAGLG